MSPLRTCLFPHSSAWIGSHIIVQSSLMLLKVLRHRAWYQAWSSFKFMEYLFHSMFTFLPGQLSRLTDSDLSCFNPCLWERGGSWRSRERKSANSNSSTAVELEDTLKSRQDKRPLEEHVLYLLLMVELVPKQETLAISLALPESNCVFRLWWNYVPRLRF